MYLDYHQTSGIDDPSQGGEESQVHANAEQRHVLLLVRHLPYFAVQVNKATLVNVWPRLK